MRFNNSCQQNAVEPEQSSVTSQPILPKSGFLAQIPGVYAVPPVYPSLGSSSITHLLNKSPPSLVGPSTQALIRSLTCPPDAVRSLQTPKEHVTKAQATPKILKTICETIAGNIGHWNLALDLTPNKRGKTAYRKELAELIAANEKMTLNGRTLAGWLQSIRPLESLRLPKKA